MGLGREAATATIAPASVYRPQRGTQPSHTGDGQSEIWLDLETNQVPKRRGNSSAPWCCPKVTAAGSRRQEIPLPERVQKSDAGPDSACAR